jgi:hypothetical protein
VADKERLRLTLRDRIDGRTWTGHRLDVTADPDDHAAIRRHIVDMARNLDHRTGDPWWRGQYEVDVDSLDQTWRQRFTVAGAE